MVDFTSAIEFAVACVLAADVNIKTKSQVIDSIREMENQIEKLEEQNIAQHNMIEMLGGYSEVTNKLENSIDEFLEEYEYKNFWNFSETTKDIIRDAIAKWEKGKGNMNTITMPGKGE